MGKIKVILSSAFAILLVLSTFSSAAAAAENTFVDNAAIIQGYAAEENTLKLYCSSTGGTVPEADSLSVVLDGSEIPISAIETAEKEAVTYYCLVDVSGSMDPSQIRVAKQSMLTICSLLKNGDKMVIAAMGDEVVSSGFLTDRSEIKEAIDGLQRTSQDTNLYRAVVDSLQLLHLSEDATFRTCLVVFSDGGDDSGAGEGRTRQEAERAIAETRIPVYSVFTPYGAKAAGKELGSLARCSAGGEALYVTEQKLTEQEIGETIVNDMHGDLVLTLDLAGFEPAKDEMLLRFSCQTDQGTFGDTMTVYRSNLILSSPKPEPQDDQESLALEEPGKEEKAKFPLWLMITIPCVLIAAGVTVWLLIRRKKRKLQNELLQSSLGTTQAFVDPEPVFTAPTRTLRFTTIGSNSFSIELKLEEGRDTTVGRTDMADIVLNDKDKKLSGVHFAVCCQGNHLTVWDVGSTNGTRVNDVPLQGNRIDLHDGDVLGVGSYRYRVQFVEDGTPFANYGPTLYPPT